MSLTLHKVDIYPDEEDNHVFAFVFENPQKLIELKSIESTEVNYGGHAWSIVCMRREDRHLGVFLKWRYADGTSSAHVSAKVKYSITLIHRHDYKENRTFMTSQKFSSAQPLLGKTWFAQLDDILDQAAGYLDDTGRQFVMELAICRCATRFEKLENVSPANRTKKNASGVYFDTSTFALAGHRWYLRFYTTKINSNGLPAIYLYLAGKAKGVALDIQFALFLGEDATEILTYSFGEGAKFDGFGKTLPEPLYQAEKLTELGVAVEITAIVAYKYAVVKLRANSLFSPRMYKDSYSSPFASNSALSSSAAEPFQDHEGNHWKVEVVRDVERLTFTFDKAIHHFPNSRTKLLCWTAVLCSRDPKRGQDISMRGNPVQGYFSNLIDDKGYIMTFPLLLAQLDERDSPYVDDSGDALLRINFISLQTTPYGQRSGPRFDYQFKHLLKARQELQESSRSLLDMREMTASRASLSLLDDHPVSESSTSSGQGGHEKTTFYKSYDSLDALSSGDIVVNGDSDHVSRCFLADVLNDLANHPNNKSSSKSDDFLYTGRDVISSLVDNTSSAIERNGVDDVTTLIGMARSSSVDLHKQKELVTNVIKILKRLPLRVSEILEVGSLGTGTTTRSRVDADLIIFSPDVPRSCQSLWMPALLRAIKNLLIPVNSSQDHLIPLPSFTDVVLTSRALQFTCDGVDIDVMVTHDWKVDLGGSNYTGLYDASCKEESNCTRQWLSLASARLQKKIICDQPNEVGLHNSHFVVKELIKVVKHWRNCVQWKKCTYRPNSYLLSLLVIKAAEETKSYDIKRIVQKVGSYIFTSELRLSWNIYYVADQYLVTFEPPTPLVRDPANPAFNVAATLSYWGQLRSEYAHWMRSLDVAIILPAS